ncbi:cathepsin L-like peptidase isoform X2 [Babylonia areolata]|uniref:cathepsin L-like peptidase isoform X2 n=1 Tax=Babylonia areolata TaxID=304850 RepID=UPI003FD601DF
MPSAMVAPLVLGVAWVCLQAADAAPWDLDRQWEIFKHVHQKSYDSDRTEAARRKIWESNLKMIVRHNLQADRGVHSYRLGINHLADMTQTEIVKTLNGFKTSAVKLNETAESILYLSSSASDLPQSVDWRTRGYVTSVKNQGNCGSCWAFSSTGALEAQHFNKTGRLMSLSEQNLMDCSFTEGNVGCRGGTMNAAFIYVHKNKGIDTEQSYPYEGKNDGCRFRTSDVGATDNGYVNVAPKGSELALQRALAEVGPISVGIDASLSTFHFYKSGVYYDPNCSALWLDHGVLAVGYGHSVVGSQDFWLVKNRSQPP